MVELVGRQTIDVNGPVNICVSRGKINPLRVAGENGLLISFLEASKGHHLVSNFPIFLPPLLMEEQISLEISWSMCL